MNDEFFNREERNPHAVGLECEGFWDADERRWTLIYFLGMKKTSLCFDVAQHGAGCGGGWFGFEGLCATLLARTDGYAHSV